MKAYSVDLRQKIVGAYEAGNISIRKVAKLFQVSKSTVQGLLKQKKEKGTIAPRTATGGKASQLSGYEQQIKAMVDEHSDYTLSEYCEYWEEKTGVRLSESAMCRFLKKQNLTLKKKHSGAVKPQQKVTKTNE
jgi:putative transposase